LPVYPDHSHGPGNLEQIIPQQNYLDKLGGVQISLFLDFPYFANSCSLFEVKRMDDAGGITRVSQVVCLIIIYMTVDYILEMLICWGKFV